MVCRAPFIWKAVKNTNAGFAISTAENALSATPVWRCRDRDNSLMLPKKLKYEGLTGRKKPKFFGFFLFFSLLVVTFASLTVSYFSLHREIPALYKSFLSRNWSKTEGRIIKTYTSKKFVSSGSSKNPRSAAVFVPNVNYSFQIENETFTGERINFAGEEKHFSLEEESQQYLNSRYRLNQNVEVFYNPDNPRESALSREYVYDSGSYQAGCCCGSIGIFFGVLLWFSFKDLISIFRKQKNDDKQ